MKNKVLLVALTMVVMTGCENFNRHFDRLVGNKPDEPLHRNEQTVVVYKCCPPIAQFMQYSCRTLAYYESHPGTNYLPIPVLIGDTIYSPASCN